MRPIVTFCMSAAAFERQRLRTRMMPSCLQVSAVLPLTGPLFAGLLLTGPWAS